MKYFLAADVDGYEAYVVHVNDNIVYYDDTTGGNVIVPTSSNLEQLKRAELSLSNSPQTQSTFLKVDENGKGLGGATFTIYTDISCDDAYKKDTVTSDENGRVQFTFRSGIYYMKETTAPANYQLDTALYRLTITTGANLKLEKVEVDENGNPEYDSNNNLKVVTVNGRIVNVPSNTNLIIKKTDADGGALGNAEFQITKDDDPYMINGGNTSIFSPTIPTGGKEAIFTIVGIDNGSYSIVETKAPAGYYGMSNSIDFTVSNGKVVYTETNSGVTFTGDGTESNPYTFVIENHTGSELPSTGGPGTLPYTIGGLLLMAASLLCGFGQRRKRERGAEG